MTATTKPRKRYWETGDFWKDAGERVVTAFIGGCLAVMSPFQFDLVQAHLTWQIVVIGGGVGGALNALAALIGAQRSNSTTPVSIL